MKANQTQIGGDHYKADVSAETIAADLGYNKAIEHWDLVLIRGYGYLQGNASKYLDRYDKKGTPIQDLEKAKHYLDLLIQLEQREGGV